MLLGFSCLSACSLWAAWQGLSLVCTPVLPVICWCISCQGFYMLMQPLSIFLMSVCCCTLDCIQTYFTLRSRAEPLGVRVAVLQSRSGWCCHCCSCFFDSLPSPTGHHRARGDLLTVRTWHGNKQLWHLCRPRETKRGSLQKMRLEMLPCIKTLLQALESGL